MTDAQSIELGAILEAAAARPRPAIKYDRMLAEEFVIVWSYQRCITVFSVLAIVAGVCRKRGAEIPDAEITAIMNLAVPILTRSGILALAEKYYEPGLCWVLAECMSEQPYVISELENRMHGRQIGKYLAVAPATIGKDVDTCPLENFLWKDPRLKRLLTPHRVMDGRRNLKATDESRVPFESPFRENEYELGYPMDHGLLKAMQVLDAKIKAVDLPPYPLPLRPDVQHLWETTIAEVWREDIANNGGRITAGLSIDDTVIKEKVRASLRNLWATADRRRELASNASQYQAGTPASPMAEATWRADWGETIATIAACPRPEDRLEAEESRHETLQIIDRIYTIARKRWGLKGRKFLDKLKTGSTAKDAALAARISPRTGKRILETIRKYPNNTETADKTKR